MAWGNGGLFVLNVAGALSGGTAINLTATTHRLALFTNSVTPDFGVSIATSAYNTGVWTTGNENATGTGYTQGGTTLATGATGATMAPSLTQSPAGTMMWDMNDFVVTTMTLAAATFGCYIYADASSPKIGLIGVPFGGGYTPSAGTFTIQWPATGVAAIDLTP